MTKKCSVDLVLTDVEEIMTVVEALSSVTRLNILKLLFEEELSVTELSERFHMSKGTISTHIATLEKAGLVESTYVPGQKGVKKVIKPKYDKIVIVLNTGSSPEEPHEDGRGV